MNRRTLFKALGVFSLTASTLGVSALFLAPAQAGGFGIRVELPPPPTSRPSTSLPESDTVLIVRAIGCYGPGASISSKAVGLVNGTRVTLPIRLEPLDSDLYGGSYIVKRQWPIEGAWVVSLSAKSAYKFGNPGQEFRPVTNVLVEFAPDGSIPNVNVITGPDGKSIRVVRTLHTSSQDKDKKIAAALKARAAAAAAAQNVASAVRP